MTMTTTTTDTARDLTPVITYRTLGGAPVAVHDMHLTPADPDLRGHHYNATCAGCLDQCRATPPYADLREAREWASRHAGVCRALPQTAPTGEQYRALAADCAARAVRLLEGKSVTPDRISKLPLEARSPLELAQTYTAIAGVYARLSGPDVRLEHANGTAV